MTMSQVSDKHQLDDATNVHQDKHDRLEPDIECLARAADNDESVPPQQVMVATRQPTDSEQIIINEIDKCFINWHEPWRQSFLDGGPKFGAVYDLMEGLIHYEEQIISSQTTLPSERLNAIAKAVARLIDYGNAILDIDITIRSNDETFRELDPISMTTIELYKSHIKAYKLRKKLMDNYFRRNKQENSDIDNTVASSSPSSASLRVPHSASWSFPSPTMDRSQRFSIGSNTSINTLGPKNTSSSDGRITPQPLSTSHIEVKTMSSTEDLTESQLEMRHMIATIRSKTFSDNRNSSTRHTLLLGVLAKIDSLLTMPTNSEKLTNCFNLLDTLLDTIERLPVECRKEEVRMIASSVLKTLVRKVFIDDRDTCVEFQHSHWTTYLLSIIRMMSTSDYDAYLKTFSNQPDLSSFLKDYLFIIKRLFSSRKHSDSTISLEADNEPIYPECWVEMSLLVCSTFLKSLMYLYQILRQYFGSNTRIWHSYIECLIHFILQDVLNPNRPMLKERQRLAANDLRKASADYVRFTWNSLNSDQRYEILEDIIEPILKACMTLSSQQRSILLPIFHDMVQSDYSNQYMSPRGTICNSGSISGQSMLDHMDDHNFSRYGHDGGNLRRSDGHTEENLFLAPPKIHHENSEESLPYLSLPYNQNSTGFPSSSDDGTVLTKFTHLIIGKLYTLMIDQDLGDDQFKSELCAAIAGIGESSAKYNHHNQRGSLTSTADMSQFKSMARHTSELVAEFMQIGLDLRQATRLSYSHLHLLCLCKLILFFRDKVDRIELYLSNLHKLWRLHHSASRYVEAGFTLLEHAKSLPWTRKPLESHYRIMTRSFQSPVSDYMSLKLCLYTTIIEYFDQGQLWESAVPLCRELIDIYQFRLFDYEKLSQIFARLSSFFASISSGQLRSQPEYFRVSFYGVGFPESLKNTTMIYRGKPYEKLSEFSATLLSKYPDARLLKTLSQPDESLLMEPDAKYLQMNACTPVVDLKSKFNSLSPDQPQTETSTNVIDINELQESILLYYKHNECDKFEFSRRIEPPKLQSSSTDGHNHQSGDDFANMWRQRVILTTNSLPGMLPFFPVFLTETTIVSPIECAIEDLERANDRLVSMVNRFKADKHKTQDVRPLGQLLLGIVDAAVNGGITKYEQAFFNNSDIKQRHTNHHHQQEQNDANKNHLTTKTNSCDQTRAPPPLPPPTPPQPPAQAFSSGDAFKMTNSCTGVVSPSGSTVSNAANKHDQTEHTTSGFMQGFEEHQNEHNAAEQQHQPTFVQLEKLKCLIAKQVPLLDEAIRLHRDRVADIMRPQHDHLEASFRRLKNHVVSKYYRYLDKSDYNRSTNTTRSLRSFARSPNRSIRSESRISLGLAASSTIVVNNHQAANSSFSTGRFGRKRMSDVCNSNTKLSYPTQDVGDTCLMDAASESAGCGDEPKSTTSIPYMQLINERRSLPFISGIQNLSILDRQQSPLATGFPSDEPTRDELQSKGLRLARHRSPPPSPPPPPLPARHRISSNEPVHSHVPPPQPPTVFYQPEPEADKQTANSSNYVCLSDMMQAIGRKDSNPYVRLSPDSDADAAANMDGERKLDTRKDSKSESTLVTL